MPLVSLLIVLVVIGLLLYLTLAYIPLAPPFRQIITAVVVIGTVLWLLGVFGIISPMQTIRVR